MNVTECKSLVSRINQSILEAGRRSISSEAFGERRFGTKSLDKSIVTETDKELDRFLKAQMQELFPGAYVLSEESAESETLSFHEIFEHEFIVAVDPLDGSQNYTLGVPDYGISVGVLKKTDEGHVPFLGSLFFPQLDELIYTDSENSYCIRDLLNSGFSINELEGAHEITLAPPPFSLDDVRAGILELNPAYLFRFNYGTLNENVRVSGCTTTQLARTCKGTALGTISSGHLWDLAGGLAIGVPIGVKLFELGAMATSSAQKRTFTVDDFVHKGEKLWELNETYFIGTEAFHDFAKHVIVEVTDDYGVSKDDAMRRLKKSGYSVKMRTKIVRAIYRD